MDGGTAHRPGMATAQYASAAGGAAEAKAKDEVAVVFAGDSLQKVKDVAKVKAAMVAAMIAWAAQVNALKDAINAVVSGVIEHIAP